MEDKERYRPLKFNEERKVLIFDYKIELDNYLNCFGIPENKRLFVEDSDRPGYGYIAVGIDTDNFVYLCRSQSYGREDQICLCQESDSVLKPSYQYKPMLNLEEGWDYERY